jgi:hypothetical protein
MNRRILIAFATAAMLAGAPATFAQDQKQPPGDKQVAADYKTEAAQLHGKAEHHRKLASLYRGRTAPKGGASYESVAKHCDKLAQFYDDAAKEAEGVATELSK